MRVWISAHLHYGSAQDTMLSELVAPLVNDLTGTLATDWFYLRYWDGGPHVRLRVLAADPRHRTAIEESITRYAKEFFARRPSPQTWSDESYRKIGAYLASAEGLDDFTRQMYPDNSVQFIEYRPEYKRYGTGELMRAVESHFGESSRLSLRLLGSAAGKGRCLTTCYVAVLTAWLTVTRDREIIVQWADYRNSRFAGTVESNDFEDRYLRQRVRLAPVTKRIFEALNEGSSTRPPLREWSDSVGSLADLVTRKAMAEPDSVVTIEWPGNQGRLELACVLPLLDICAHLFCNRMGISPQEEQYVRYLAARALTSIEKEGQSG